MLSDLLGENDIGLPVIYSEHLTSNGKETYEHPREAEFLEHRLEERAGSLCKRIR